MNDWWKAKKQGEHLFHIDFSTHMTMTGYHSYLFFSISYPTVKISALQTFLCIIPVICADPITNFPQLSPTLED